MRRHHLQLKQTNNQIKYKHSNKKFKNVKWKQNPENNRNERKKLQSFRRSGISQVVGKRRSFIIIGTVVATAVTIFAYLPRSSCKCPFMQATYLPTNLPCIHPAIHSFKIEEKPQRCIIVPHSRPEFQMIISLLVMRCCYYHEWHDASIYLHAIWSLSINHRRQHQ